jgi:hypothetical protein
MSKACIAIAALLCACRGPVDVRGLYIASDHRGSFVPCEHPDTIFYVTDTTLAATYRRAATSPHEWLFVRLRAVQSDSGSIYSGSHYLRVQQVLEIRERAAGECPRITEPTPLSSAAPIHS